MLTGAAESPKVSAQYLFEGTTVFLGRSSPCSVVVRLLFVKEPVKKNSPPDSAGGEAPFHEGLPLSSQAGAR
jgi:hypothetical protein